MINILAASFRDNDDIDAAISTAKEAVRLFPDELYGRVVLCGALALVTAEGAAAELAQEIVRIDPSFTISRYAETLPYEDKATLDRITEGLDRAGLPM